MRLVKDVSLAPSAGQATIRVLAAGVGCTDVMARRGEHLFQRRRPFTPVYEIVGEVVGHTGDTAPGWLVPGARVAAWPPRLGGYTEYANVPATSLAPVPDGLDTVVTAAMPLDHLTALLRRHPEGVHAVFELAVRGRNRPRSLDAPESLRLRPLQRRHVEPPAGHDLDDGGRVGEVGVVPG
ncbi:alcohol dehydrogenase catalytic domain-containing protein, partial [Nonomuraea diastatica]